MVNNSPNDGIPGDADLEALKKTTRISLEEALSSMSATQKAGPAAPEQGSDKKVTGPISGIPTHTAPIPQTIRLKRPSTSPIVIGSPEVAGAAPTVIKTTHARPPSSPITEAPTVIKKAAPAAPMNETSRIILEIDEKTATVRQKTAPVPIVSQIEPTPPPKTIRLKKPSAVMPVAAVIEPSPEAQTAKKSETAKIELPKTEEFQTPTTQRKTIKIRRTDRNVMPRTVKMVRPEEKEEKETQPPAETAPETFLEKEEAVAPKTAAAAAAAPEAVQDETIIVFPIAAGLAAACLLLLVYLLAAQALGPGLALPVPAGLH